MKTRTRSQRHSIQDRVHAVAAKANRLRVLYGVAWFSSSVLAASLLMGFLDVLFRFRDPGVRMIGTLAVVGVAGWTFYRFVMPCFRQSSSEIQVAQRIEGRFPQLRDRLSSSLAFLGQSEAEITAGSADLRRAVVSQTTGDSADLNFLECLDSSRTNRAVAIALCWAVLVAAAVVAAPRTSAMAAVRLLAPWGGPEWPRQHQLTFEHAPTRLARGQDFLATVIDENGRLPEHVVIEYRFDDVVQSKPMRFMDGKMVHRLNNVSQSFSYRAVGGDDRRMPWHEVAVVDPPQLTEFRVVVSPPGYTQFPSVEQSAPQITATEGSHVVIAGQSTKPLREVVLRLENEHLFVGSSRKSIRGQLDESTQSFQIATLPGGSPLELSESGRYWLELTDQEAGVPAPTERWEIRVRPDAAPTVSIQQPVGNLLVTRQAAIPVSALCQDDLGIQDVVLRYSQPSASAAAEQQTILLYSAAEDQEGVATIDEPSASTRSTPRSSTTGSSAAPAGGIQLPLDYTWDLREVAGLQPDDSLEFQVVVRDFKPQSAESSVRRISIISPNELEERIAQKRSYILSQLAEVLRVQRQGRSQTRSLEIQLDETDDRFRRSDVNRLQSTELNQRQVEQLITQPNDGVEAQIEALLQDIERNRLDNPDVVSRMTELLKAVRLIARRDLPLIERDLLTALRSARSQWQEGSGRAAPDNGEESQVVDPLVRSSIEQAGQRQQQVIEQLEQLLGELSEWDSYRRFSRMVNRVLANQSELLQDTEKVRLDTITKDENDLSDQEKSDLRQLLQRQLELARRVETIQSTMQQLERQLQETDPVAAQTVSDAMETARRLAISGQMREGARRIEQNRVGQATEHQKEATTALEELLDVLSNRREHELGRLLRKMEQARQDLQELAARQKGLRKKWQDAAGEQDEAEQKRQLQRLQREQQELQAKTEELGRRLERLQAEKAQQSTAQAAQQQKQAADAAQQGDADQAAGQAAEADKLLEQAVEQLQQEIQQAKQDLVAEQLARLEQILKGFELRQRAIQESTVRFDEIHQQSGEWQREQLVALGDLTEQQQFLAGEVGALLPQFEEAEAFALALRGIVREMTRAAAFLERQDPGRPAQQAQQNALQRLQQLSESLQPETREEANDQPPPMGGGDQNPPPNPDALTALAELKLVQLMQKEIHARTSELEQIRQSNGELTPAQQQERGELAVEQGRLSRILLNLSVPEPTPEDGLTEDPADTSDAPPDLDLSPLDKALEDSLKP